LPCERLGDCVHDTFGDVGSGADMVAIELARREVAGLGQ
jgi:hypothetical protein